ncbi:MAG: cro/C1-type DNA-binding domain protein [Clostridia bacterium]|jgi:transcriptional regulator with XRE-family HTH domain|nr:cro/C1-type DNA-binding domain protein [Clostridia bacterium]
MQTLGERLKNLRNSKKLTMDKLAEVLNEKYDSKINKGMISKWENNLSEPSLDNAKVIANFFGKSLDYIIGVEDSTNDNTQNELLTVAAHHDGVDWTEEELKELEDFKKYVLSKRQH